MKTSSCVALRRTGAAFLLAAALAHPAAASHSVILGSAVPVRAEEATIWCGAATAQMVMEGYPTPPGPCAWIQDPAHLQSDVAAQIADLEGLWDADPGGLRDAMSTLCPLPAGHHWVAFAQADPTVLMRSVAFWMTANNFPVAALLDTTAHHGDPAHLEHWVAIKGIITDVNPTSPGVTSVALENVWFNDPGLPLGDPAASRFVTGSVWYTLFQAVAKPGSSYDGKYVAVIEPPASTGRATALREVLSGRLISARDALAAAERSIRDVGLPRIGPYEILGRAKPLPPLLVDARYGGYYLIPYAVEGDQAEAALFINAYTGGFQEADAFSQKARFLSEDEARQIALRSLKAAQPKSVEAELVSSAESGGASRSRPLWKVRVDGRTVGVTQDGTVVTGVSGEAFSIPVPARRPQGLAAGNGRLWTADAETGEILELAPRSGNVVRRIATGLRQLQGLAFDGERLWAADQATREILAFHPEDGQRLRSLPFQSPPEKGFRGIAGLAWDGGHLWTAIAAGFSSSFNQIDGEGRIVRSLFADCDPRGLAVEDGHLWSLCYNGERNPPTLDRRDLLSEESAFQRSRVFLEKTAGRRPSGLAFDGTSLWYLDAGTKRAYRYTPAQEAQP
jgi:hypothetical protein